MPLHGYTRLFERMLDHPNIKILLNTDYREVRDLLPYREVIYTGPIDEYFDYRFGTLPYRSLEFRFETHDMPRLPAGAGGELPQRLRLHPRHRVQVPDRAGAPSRRARLRVPAGRGRPLLPDPQGRRTRRSTSGTRRWRTQTPGVHFVGRLATYKYYNMDQVVAQALAEFQRIIGAKPSPAARNGARPTAVTTVQP